jgi:diacylglycerol kinase family enzyme
VYEKSKFILRIPAGVYINRWKRRCRFRNENARKHLFIINPVSFGGKAGIDAFTAGVQACFTGDIKAEHHIHVSQFPRDAIRTVRRYITQVEPETPVRVYAVGGDGILFDCLNGLIGLPNAELAMVPYGHTNDFMRAFGEGLRDIFRNIPLQAAAPLIATDILHCGSNYAMNLCTVGIESEALFKAVHRQHQMRKWPSFLKNNACIYNFMYILGGVEAMFNKKVRNQEYTVSIDEKDASGAYVNINIANGPCCGGDKNEAVTAVPDDGFMDILLFRKVKSAFEGLVKIVPYTAGHYDRFPADFTLKRGKVITIRSSSPLTINMDGEVFYDTNLTVELIPAAVNIVAPNNLPYCHRSAAQNV